MQQYKDEEICYDESKGEIKADGSHIIRNSHLQHLSHDVLYHLALSTETHALQEMFGDVRFVCVGGTATRMESFANYIRREINIKFPTGTQLQDLTKSAHRYSMFKVGPVLSVSHGMGTSSLSILLHELIKLIHYAKCKDVTFIRLGTSGGIGVDVGTVVVSEKAVDGLLRPYNELYILGKVVRRPAVFDSDLFNELKSIGESELRDFKTVTGTTMCTLDFYESQGRLDGAFCNYTAIDKMNYLNTLKKAGVVNIEMEAITFASMCHYAGIKGAIICVTIVDRLNGDQVEHDDDFYKHLQMRPQMLAAKFIKKRLALND